MKRHLAKLLIVVNGESPAVGRYPCAAYDPDIFVFNGAFVVEDERDVLRRRAEETPHAAS